MIGHQESAINSRKIGVGLVYVVPVEGMRAGSCGSHFGVNSGDGARRPQIGVMLSLTDGDVAGDRSAGARRTAQPAPDRAYVMVWRGGGGSWCVGHVLSSEVQQLRRQDGRLIAEVELAHDEEDFTTLLLHPAGRGDPEIVSALDVFTVGAYIDDEGVVYLDTGGDPDIVSLTPLRDLVNDHTLMDLELRNIAPLRSSMRIPSAIFGHPCSDGCHILVSVSSIVKVLDLDPSKDGSASRG